MRSMIAAALSVMVLGVCVRSVQGQACRNGCSTHPDVSALNCVSGLANESGPAAFFSTSGIPACSAAGTYEVQHATRFDVVGNTEITHLCIATFSSTISGVAIYSSAGSPSQPPAAVPLFSVFSPAVTNVGNVIIVNVAPVNAPLVVNGGFWVVTSYNNVTPTTVTQGVSTRTAGKAMMRFNQNCNLCVQCGAPCAAALPSCQTWVDYDNIGMFQYLNNAPRIRPLRFDNPPPFCPAGGQYTQNCCDQVCVLDPSCCVSWDPVCFALAAANCPTNCNIIPPAGSYVEQEPCPLPPPPPPNANNSCISAEVVPCNAPAIYGTISAHSGIADADWYAIDLFNHDGTGMTTFQLNVTSESPVDVEVWTGDPGFNCNQNQLQWQGVFVPSCTTTAVNGVAGFPPGASRERFFVVVRSAITDRNSCATGTNEYLITLNFTNCSTQANDDCANAVPVLCSTSLVGSTGAATPSNPPGGCGAPGSPDVWYSIVGANENIRLDTCGSSTPHLLAVFIGGCGNLNCIAQAPLDTLGVCANPNDASLEFFGFSGITYHILVAAQNVHGNFNLNVSCAPPNDSCLQAEIVGCGVTTLGNSTHANNSGAPICNGIPNAQGDLWYYMQGPGGTVNVDLCGSLVNHQISVYSGSCAGPTCIDATFSDTLGICGGVSSSLSFNTIAGDDYWILVHANGPTGEFTLNVQCPPPGVPNDDCANAMLVVPGGFVWDNCGATTDGPPEPCGFTGIDDNDVWYEFIASCDGTWLIHVGPAPVDKLVGVYDACPPNGALIACTVDPAGAPVNLAVPVIAGQSYWVRIGSTPGTCSNAPLAFMETCGPSCPADCVNSATFQPPPDGVVDAADLAVLLGAWGPCPAGGCCSDTVTSATFQPPPDGVVDAADLAFLLGSWGPCP